MTIELSGQQYLEQLAPRVRAAEITVPCLDIKHDGKWVVEYFETTKEQAADIRTGIRPFKNNLPGDEKQSEADECAPVISNQSPGINECMVEKPLTSRGTTPSEDGVNPSALPISKEIKIVTCVDCGTDHPENENCFICEPLLRAMLRARRRARNYHQYKKSLPPKKSTTLKAMEDYEPSARMPYKE